ncbi:hypothetical protein [Nocardia sp. BMG51109]|uniref:hypothetical protein n=1 Tax=Nocardia sp. BMG51109 TaxID=1056816 RepID=UPI0004AE0A07|nr:hypothetical protein [Nocardia sp. BMG51109]
MLWVFALSLLGVLVFGFLAVRWWPRRIPPGRSVHDIRRRIDDERRHRPHR